MISRYFSSAQLRGMSRAGQVLLPGSSNSPAFTETGCIAHVDRMAQGFRNRDRAGLCLVFSLFARLPRPFIALIFWILSLHPRLPGPLGAGLRMAELGIKGAVFSPYYANLTAPDYQGPSVHGAIGWNPKFVTLPPVAAPPEPSVILDRPGPEDIPAIYSRARAVESEIRDWGTDGRVKFISALKAGILDRREEILDVVQADTGKSRLDALTAEIFGTLDWLTYLEKQAVKSLADQRVPTPFALMGKKSRVYFEPLGTVLLISPWNYPFYQAIVPITQAFVCGNAVVFKPSTETPLKGLVEDLLTRAGFPRDWVQVVYGSGGRIGDALVDGRPDKIFLIGSPHVGRHIMERAARHLIPVELELGGKDPMVVFDDVDIPRAVSGALWGTFTTTGQSCTSVERPFVQEGIYDAFRARLQQLLLQLPPVQRADARFHQVEHDVLQTLKQRLEALE
ncbi:MAG: aldehyde dehydrogenase family protein, partial [Desulfobacterales bacterium]|nr:aldehyde dehydrogenase family protein [Desulfobacterales bacterium]